MTLSLSRYVTDDMMRDAVDKISASYAKMTAGNERKQTLEFTDDETSFETCHLFDERYPDGSGGVMHIFHQLPARTQALLNEAVRTRLLRPGALNNLLGRADRGRGSGTSITEQSACHLEDCLVVASMLASRHPDKASMGAVTVSDAISKGISGVNHRRLTKDRVPIRGRLTEHQLNVALALVYLELDNDRPSSGYNRNYAVESRSFTDAEGNECYGTVLLNHELGRVINERPETAIRISAYLNTHSPIDKSKKAAEHVIAYADSGLHNAVVDGWL
jgi:hypothetical protein